MTTGSTPPGLIREARSSDAEAIARVHVESSEDAYAPLAKEWAGPSVQARASQWQSWLAESATETERVDLLMEFDGSVIAFISAGSARRQDIGAEVEVRVIHVLPGHRGRGFGDRLWTAAAQRVRGQGLRSMYVATFAELRCCSFYEAHGGLVASRSPRVFHGGSVTEVIYVWSQGRSSERLAREGSGEL